PRPRNVAFSRVSRGNSGPRGSFGTLQDAALDAVVAARQPRPAVPTRHAACIEKDLRLLAATIPSVRGSGATWGFGWQKTRRLRVPIHSQAKAGNPNEFGKLLHPLD